MECIHEEILIEIPLKDRFIFLYQKAQIRIPLLCRIPISLRKGNKRFGQALTVIGMIRKKSHRYRLDPRTGSVMSADQISAAGKKLGYPSKGIRPLWAVVGRPLRICRGLPLQIVLTKK